MTNVLFVYESRFSSVELLEHMLEGMAAQKGFCLKSVLYTKVSAQNILDCDIFLCARSGGSPLMCELLKKARAAGRFVIYFMDDDLQHLPKGTFTFPGHVKFLLDGLKYSDLFLTSNRLLLEEYLPLIGGNRAFILESPIQEEDIQHRDPKGEDDTIRIVYAGASTHVDNWNKFVAPIWPAIAEKYGSRISMTFVGLHPDVHEDGFGAVVEYVPPMKLADYRQYMRTHRFDIGLSPLETNHFTERKYYNKFIEYSLYGICGVYSNCPPYTLVVRDGANGLMADNDPQSWQKALEKAIENRGLRERCVDNAQELLRCKFTPNSIYNQFVTEVPELVSFHAPEGQAIAISRRAKLRQNVFRLVERAYLMGLSVKMYGISSTLERIKSKIKR